MGAKINERDELPIKLKSELDGDYVENIGLKKEGIASNKEPNHYKKRWRDAISHWNYRAYREIFLE